MKIEASIIKTEKFSYTRKNDGSEAQGLILWISFPGDQLPMKYACFGNQIQKAEKYIPTGKASFTIEPDRNLAPRFALA